MNGHDKKQLSGTPSAPSLTNASPYGEDEFVQCPPPPSYEESLRMNNSAPHVAVVPQQQQQSQPPPQYGTPYGYANPYQTHIQQQQQYYFQPMAPGTSYQGYAATTNSANPKVLTLAKGAQIRTTPGGAISIPPPPPGCAPTPAQYAAMQGQRVVVKKTKKSFF